MIATILELTYNLALLVALSVISGFIRQHRRFLMWKPILQGLLFGGAAVLGMMKPLVLGPGLIFDGRSVMLSVCGLFFGPVAVAVAAGMALLYRILLGGPGVCVGGLVIASSALLGLGFHLRWPRNGKPLTVGRLWGLGMLVHVVMLLLMFTLPAGSGVAVIQRLGLPILLAYPLVTVVIGKLLSTQEAGMLALEALKESEAKHRQLIVNSHDIIYTLTPEGIFTFVSPAWTVLLGHSTDQVVGQSFELFVHKDDVVLCRAWLQKVIETGQRQEGVEYRVCHLDGTWKWHSSSAMPIRNANETVTGFEGTASDMTERKQAEVALQESEERFKSLHNASFGGISVHDKGIILECNRGLSEMTGYSYEELIGMNGLLLVAPDSREFVLDMINTGYEKQYEANGLRKNGDTYPMQLEARNINYRGKKVRTVEFRDVSERKKAEAALHLSEQKFRTLFENLTEGMALHELVMDADGQVQDYRLLDVNPAYQRHTGLEAATALGLLGTEIYGTQVPPYLAEFSQVALGGEPYAFETYFPPLDKHFHISVISPRPGQFATVFEDITERKHREEELKQKNAEMERFTYMISHDLKSPLVTVRTFLGYLEQDLEQGKGERVAKDMGFIRDATGKMGRLLEDLLEVSRVGRVVNPPVRVRLADLIAEALAAVAGAISTRGVDIKVEVPALVLCGDRPRLEEIWQNLVENAVKYMGEQSAPRIELGAQGTGADTVFFVRDNGLGIDPKFQEKVFGLFEQLDASSEGTGLGLALVKRIVEIYEGRIWLESEGVGRGTCFRFTLPLALKVMEKNDKEGARS